MRVNEVITEAKKDSSTADDVVDFGKEVGTDVASIPKGIWGRAKDTAKAAFDPDTYIKAGSDARDATDRGIEFAKKDPEGAAKYAVDKGLEAGGDFTRAGLNAATFGGTDYARAGVNSLIKGTKFDDELSKEFNKSADARDRSPIASTLGDLTGLVANPAFGLGIKGAGLAAKTVAPSIVKALKYAPNKTAVDIAKNVAKGTVKNPSKLAVGIAAEKAAQKAAQKVDPDNPYVNESARLKELIKYRS
jgi:hypothetical protein